MIKLTGVVLISGRDHGGRRKEGVHTEGIHADMVTGKTVELRKVGDVKGPKVEAVLPALPH